MHRANIVKDPVERMKFVISAMVASALWSNSFLKPLNPILGETLEAEYIDGTQIFAEQVCHHPPISNFYVVGPNDSYKFYGNYNYDIKAWINSVAVLDLM